MNPQKVIYKPGELNIRTSISEVNGVEYADYSFQFIYDKAGKNIGYTENKTVAEYLVELNKDNTGEKFITTTWEEAYKLINEAQNKTLIGEWEEITEEVWDEALNCLLPEKWKTVNGVNIFRMCEYYTDNITMHYAKVNGKYFKANRRATDDYEELARQVLKLI